jgi:spiro-SPASM protein
MECYVVFNAIHLDHHAFKPIFPKGVSSLQRSFSKARALSPSKKIFLLTREALREKVEEHLQPVGGEEWIVHTLVEKKWNSELFLGALQSCAEKAAETASFDAFYHIYADAPLLDPDIAERMAKNHEKYFATYSFADGYPRFIAPEILSVSVLGQLGDLFYSQKSAGKEIIFSDTLLFDIIQKDINAFDIETEISPRDLRLLRVELVARGRRNSMLLERIIDKGGEDETSILSVLEEKPEILRTLPAFIYMQVHSACPQHCRWCPWPEASGGAIDRQESMTSEQVGGILDQVVSLCESATVGFSLWGETALHPDFVSIMAELLARPSLDALVETSGIGWSLEVLDALAALDGAGERLNWIVSLDAFHPESYRSIRGEGMEEATAAVSALEERFPGNVRVQAVRTRENEAELEQFYRHWSGRNIGVIIQKYDSFAGRLEDLKVSDLSPLERFPCWHLKRDLHVLLDGTVPLCRTDGTALGNVFRDSLEEIWNRGEERYKEHARGEWKGVCGSCDEYYTFNF